ncbi:hypothetical protein [Neorhizobium tomejilense]|jgi:hypothetical protein|uniref:hypothetical protein n=1 Tax=Neorhizobium tomejilense TaxID=2093828 RepID=UPI003ECD2350
MELLLGLFALLFVALKLTGHIKWSWPLVLAPIWVPLSLAVMAGVLLGAASV